MPGCCLRTIVMTAKSRVRPAPTRNRPVIRRPIYHRSVGRSQQAAKCTSIGGINQRPDVAAANHGNNASSKRLTKLSSSNSSRNCSSIPRPSPASQNIVQQPRANSSSHELGCLAVRFPIFGTDSRGEKAAQQPKYYWCIEGRQRKQSNSKMRPLSPGRASSSSSNWQFQFPNGGSRRRQAATDLPESGAFCQHSGCCATLRRAFSTGAFCLATPWTGIASN